MKKSSTSGWWFMNVMYIKIINHFTCMWDVNDTVWIKCVIIVIIILFSFYGGAVRADKYPVHALVKINYYFLI